MDPAESRGVAEGAAGLEQLIDRELRRLPAPRAPRTLLPRVMLAVRAAAEPIVVRGWFTWSREWQAASLAALILLVVGGVLMLPLVQSQLSGHPAGAIVGAFRVVWRVVLQPLSMTVMVFVALMMALCAVGTAALRRVS